MKLNFVRPNLAAFLDFERLPRWFWPVLLGLSFGLHAPFFQLPPSGAHVWRQCNTLAVARNFYEEDMNILRPRVDRRGTTDGVTGMQFPAYEWLVAAGYHAVGFHETLPRALNWLISLAGIVAFYHLARHVSGGSAGVGAVAAWSLSWSPEVFTHSINALPDILALTASLAGLHWFGQWRRSLSQGQRQRPGRLLLSWLAVTLAGLTKLQYLAVGFPMAVFVLRDGLTRRYTAAQVGQLTAYALVAVAGPLAWYAYARALIRTSGLTDFGLEVRPAASLTEALTTITHNLLLDGPSFLLGYGTLALLLAGLVRLARAPALVRHPWFGPGLAWGVGLAVYYGLELHQMAVHIYYLLPLLPPLLLLAAWGAAGLRRRAWGRPLLLAVLLFQPAWAFARGGWAPWLHNELGVYPELLNPVSRAALEAATPAGALCVVGPDVTGCKYFYFLHKKGFGYERPRQLLDPTPPPGGRPYLAACVARGARYLYTKNSLELRDPRLRPHLSRHLLSVGDFDVWELRAPAPSAR